MKEDLLKYLDVHLHSILEDLQLDAISVYEIDRNNECATLIKTAGKQASRQKVPFGVTPLGECAKTGHGALLTKEHRREKFRSEAVIPIPGRNSPLGVLTGASQQTDYFKDKQQSDFKSLAFHLGKIWSNGA